MFKIVIFGGTHPKKQNRLSDSFYAQVWSGDKDRIRNFIGRPSENKMRKKKRVRGKRGADKRILQRWEKKESEAEEGEEEAAMKSPLCTE